MIKRIEDQDVIDELVQALNNAKTHSAADMDYPLPDYALVFKNDKKVTILRVGYYNEIMNWGSKDAIWMSQKISCIKLTFHYQFIKQSIQCFI